MNFPALNASLNALAGLCLLAGFFFIKRKNIVAHRRSMLAACAASTAFLACYLFYHLVLHAGVTRFQGTGWVRTLYFSILLSHTVLAVVILPMAIVTVLHGLKNRIARHRRIARWTFPIWLYVSVTGVIVYMFLYQWYPSR